MNLRLRHPVKLTMTHVSCWYHYNIRQHSKLICRQMTALYSSFCSSSANPISHLTGAVEIEQCNHQADSADEHAILIIKQCWSCSLSLLQTLFDNQLQNFSSRDTIQVKKLIFKTFESESLYFWLKCREAQTSRHITLLLSVQLAIISKVGLLAKYSLSF